MQVEAEKKREAPPEHQLKEREYEWLREEEKRRVVQEQVRSMGRG